MKRFSGKLLSSLLFSLTISSVTMMLSHGMNDPIGLIVRDNKINLDDLNNLENEIRKLETNPNTVMLEDLDKLNTVEELLTEKLEKLKKDNLSKDTLNQIKTLNNIIESISNIKNQTNKKDILKKIEKTYEKSLNLQNEIKIILQQNGKMITGHQKIEEIRRKSMMQRQENLNYEFLISLGTMKK